MENEPPINEEIAQTPPALAKPEKQGSEPSLGQNSEPVPMPNPFASQSPKKSKKLLVVFCVVLLVLAIGVSAVLLLNNKNDSSSQQSGDNHGQSENREQNKAQESGSENSQQSAGETSQEAANNPCTIPYIGELVAEYTDSGELYDCIIPNELVLNAPQSDSSPKFVIRPDNDGKFELTTNNEYTGSITKNDNGSFTVTIADLGPYNYSTNGGKLDNPQTSATFTFDQEVVSMGIGGYGQAVGEERAFFATSDGSVYYIGLRAIVQGETELKRFANMSNVVAFVHGAFLEATDSGQYIGGFMPYAIRNDGFVYGLTGE